MRTIPDFGAIPSSHEVDLNRRGPVSRFFSTLAAARQAAQTYERLAGLDDDRLAAMGLARSDIARVAAEPILESL